MCFVNGFAMDMSMACYFTILSVFFVCIYIVTGIKAIANIHNSIIKILFVVTFIINLSDCLLYPHWGTKISSNAFRFISNPAEVFASTNNLERTIFVVFAVLLFYILLKVNKLLPLIKNIELDYFLKERLKTFVFFILLSVISIVGIRGGVGIAPLSQSNVYFSNNAILNHGALNTIWNLLATFQNENLPNRYQYFEEGKSYELSKTIYQFESDTTKIFDPNIKKPNIVFIILEGIGTDIVASFGGEKNCTPTIDSLKNIGLSFNHFYANGDRTYKGLPALLSGFPTQPSGSIMSNPDNTIWMPSMANSLNKMNYSSHFYYGGESGFANIKTYLLNTGYQKVIDIHDFPKSYRGLKWGVSDHYMFNALAENISMSKEPFFKSILTLSSHEPYDIPMPSKFEGSDDINKFKSSVYYTDASLKTFLNKIEKYPQTENTIFVLTSDHGNQLPKQYLVNYKKQKFNIPLIIFGKPLLKIYQGKTMEGIASQTDLVASLLNQLNVQNNDFNFSQNLFNQQHQKIAFYTFDDGFGFIRQDLSYVFDNISTKIIEQNVEIPDSILQKGKALMQYTYQESLKSRKKSVILNNK